MTVGSLRSAMFAMLSLATQTRPNHTTLQRADRSRLSPNRFPTLPPLTWSPTSPNIRKNKLFGFAPRPANEPPAQPPHRKPVARRFLVLRKFGNNTFKRVLQRPSPGAAEACRFEKITFFPASCPKCADLRGSLCASKKPETLSHHGLLHPGRYRVFAFENRLSLTSIRATFARQPY